MVLPPIATTTVGSFPRPGWLVSGRDRGAVSFQLEGQALNAREKQLGLRTAEHRSGLIVPAAIHDGKLSDLPEIVRGIKPKELQDCANVRMTENSPTWEKLTSERGRS